MEIILNSLYTYVYVKDRALEKETKLEKDKEFIPDVPGEMQEAEGFKPPVVQVKAQAEKPCALKKKRARTQLEPPIEPQIELSIEEIKAGISRYHPRSFRERVAFERYREALAASPDKEEEIHRTFYSLINGKNDLEDFYRQLYCLAPKLIERLQLP